MDASAPFLAVAEAEARERGFAGRTGYLHGDFVALADRVSPAEIVTLDRVICCYPEVEALVAASVEHAQRLYGLVYPRDAWWVRAMLWSANLAGRLRRRGPKVWAHRQATIDRLLAAGGMEPVSSHAGFFWRTALWRRTAATTPRQA